MTDAEKFGLPGLMDILRGNISTDQSAIALGMDLSNLGLDLNRNEPLHKDWAGPFSDPTGMPAVPDFGLPLAITGVSTSDSVSLALSVIVKAG